MRRENIGIIGLGTMGGAICRRLVENGYEVTACDVRDEALKKAEAYGAKITKSNEKISETSDIILIVVVDDAQVRAVVTERDGLAKGVRPGTIVVIHSTVQPSTCQYCATKLKDEEVKVLDAAMSGGRIGAERGTLTLMVGGEIEALNECNLILSSYANKIFHLGDLGMGMVTKLCNNAILHSNRLSLYEGIRLAMTAGVDPQSFLEVVRVSSGNSWVAEHWAELDYKVLENGLGNHQLLEQMQKDLSAVLQLSDALGVSINVAEVANQHLPNSLRSGLLADRSETNQ